MEPWRRDQIAVVTAVFVGFTGFTLVMPFLSLYVRELGVADVADVALWTGTALAVTPLITALCAPFWGRIGDRYGNKILVQRSLVSFVIVMAAMAYVTRPWHLVALRVVQGFFAGYGALGLGMVARSAPPERMAQAIGTVQTAQRMGPAVGPVIGGVLAPLVGLRNSFLVAAAVYLLAFVLLTVLFREPARPPLTTDRRHTRVSFRNILEFENFLLLMVVLFGLQLVDRSFGPVLPLHLDRLGYGDQVTVAAGVLFSVVAVAGALGHQLAAMLMKRMSPRMVIAISTLAGAGALALFTVSEAMYVLAPAMSIVGLSLGTAATVAYSVGGAVIPRAVHGAGFGFLTSAALIGSAVSPVLSGLVGARSFRAVFALGAVVLAVLAIVVRRMMVERALTVEPTPVVEES